MQQNVPFFPPGAGAKFSVILNANLNLLLVFTRQSLYLGTDFYRRHWHTQTSKEDMLSRNDQLVPEGQGRRQKARGTCYVDEPPFGFFIAGSTVKVLNGVYIRRNIPRALRENQRTLLFYESAFFFIALTCPAARAFQGLSRGSPSSVQPPPLTPHPLQQTARTRPQCCCRRTLWKRRRR
jgi:hypothetical protein